MVVNMRGTGIATLVCVGKLGATENQQKQASGFTLHIDTCQESACSPLSPVTRRRRNLSPPGKIEVRIRDWDPLRYPIGR